MDTTVKGYYQLIEGYERGFMFTLRAGNHETIFESRLYWSRQAALDAVDEFRACVHDPGRFIAGVAADGSHFFELVGADGRVLGRSPGCASRAGVAAGIASVRRNAPARAFRGLVRRDLSFG